MKKYFFSLTLGSIIWAAPVVPLDTYAIQSTKELTSIYSIEYASLMKSIRQYQHNILSLYSHDFGYQLDDTLYAGFASSHNQISNAFSTQIPFNAQIHYMGGADTLDYFSSASWLKMIMIHETAHNYQLNPKENVPAKLAHKLVGNTPVSGIGPFPLFPLPNYFIGSFILEGNAVLNESRFGMGGRLFSGYALAQNILLAKAGKLIPKFVFNNQMEYPYHEQWYLVGGHFQAFLAKKYGLKKVNHFFKKYAEQYLPFFLNKTFENYYGKSFDVLLDSFKCELLATHQGFQKTKGNVVAQSQVFLPLNASKERVYTLISNAKDAPKILEIYKDKGNQEVSLKTTTLPLGELFYTQGKYVSQSTRMVSPTRVTKGLYDSDATLIEHTDSKVLQGYMPDGRMVYIDVKRSLEYPHIYIDGVFYDTAHSRVLVDKKGNLYYFKQQKNQRVLYKNKKKIFSMPGYYGYVADVDSEGNIYFIANSTHGTTLYKLKNHTLMRIGKGDDIVDMKLLDKERILLCTVADHGFEYKIIKQIEKSEKIASFQYSFENKYDKEILSTKDFTHHTDKSLKTYIPLLQLRYSALNQNMIWDEHGFSGQFNANFSDPLMQNKFNIFASLQAEHTLVGMGYENSENILQFGASVIGIFNDKDNLYRNYGYHIHLRYPFLQSGYWNAAIKTSYISPYDRQYQNIWHASMDIENRQQFGISKYPNRLHKLKIFTAQDSENYYYGGTYAFMHALIGQSYFSLKATYMQSQMSNNKSKQGIEIGDFIAPFSPNAIKLEMYNLDKSLYANEVGVGEIGLYKVFDASAYFFPFPLSIQRESVYTKYKSYHITSDNVQQSYTETTLGLDLDVLLYHSSTLPVQFEWIHNKDVKNKDKFRVQIGMNF